MTDLPPARHLSRFWLYAPFVLIALLAAGWSAFWFYVRERVVDGFDRTIAREAQLGRNWACADRAVSGFPFRIEVRCSGLSLTSSRWGDAVRLTTGASVAVGQIYTPGLVILNVTGPLQAVLPAGRRLDLAWSRFEASLSGNGSDVERISTVMTAPDATLSTPGVASDTWKATSLETHLRRNPVRPAADQAVDIAISAKGSVLPALDALLGSTEPGDVELQATITHSEGFRAGLNPDALEAWRMAGGQLELTKFVSTKGASRVEASGRLLLDQTHRPAGQIDVAIAGVDRIAGIRIGGLAAGLGGLLGGGRGSTSATPGMTGLPPVVLREGRFYLGPLRLPLQPLAPLY